MPELSRRIRDSYHVVRRDTLREWAKSVRELERALIDTGTLPTCACGRYVYASWVAAWLFQKSGCLGYEDVVSLRRPDSPAKCWGCGTILLPGGKTEAGDAALSGDTQQEGVT